MVEGVVPAFPSVANGSASVMFNAGDKWTATSSVDWLELSPASGEGGRNTMTITTILPNRTRQERTGSIVITSGGKCETVFVSQLDDYALFDPKEYVVDSAGGKVDMAFSTNIEKGKLYISYHILDWIEMPKLEKTRGEAWSGTVKTVTVLPNGTPEERTTSFILGYYDEKKRFMGLDTAWIHQKPSLEIVERQDTLLP